jgi:hypothetical protein
MVGGCDWVWAFVGGIATVAIVEAAAAAAAAVVEAKLQFHLEALLDFLDFTLTP